MQYSRKPSSATRQREAREWLRWQNIESPQLELHITVPLTDLSDQSLQSLFHGTAQSTSMFLLFLPWTATWMQVMAAQERKTYHAANQKTSADLAMGEGAFLLYVIPSKQRSSWCTSTYPCRVAWRYVTGRAHMLSQVITTLRKIQNSPAPYPSKKSWGMPNFPLHRLFGCLSIRGLGLG